MSLQAHSADREVARRIEESIRQGHISHAYLLEGDRTSEKLSFAKDMCRAILCTRAPGVGCDACPTCYRIGRGTYEDVRRIRRRGPSVTDEDIAGLQAWLQKKPVAGPRHVAIIEDADTMTTFAQNRLLKTLEEPPAGAVIILLAENRQHLLPTVCSRLVIYHLHGAEDVAKVEGAGDAARAGGIAKAGDAADGAKAGHASRARTSESPAASGKGRSPVGPGSEEEPDIPARLVAALTAGAPFRDVKMYLAQYTKPSASSRMAAGEDAEADRELEEAEEEIRRAFEERSGSTRKTAARATRAKSTPKAGAREQYLRLLDDMERIYRDCLWASLGLCGPAAAGQLGEIGPEEASTCIRHIEAARRDLQRPALQAGYVMRDLMLKLGGKA